MAEKLHTLAFVQAHLYKDSVALMRVAQHLLGLPGVVNASLQLGNPANKAILQEAGLLGPEVADAGPSDIMVVLQAGTAEQAEAAAATARGQLTGGGASGGAGGDADAGEVKPSSISQAQVRLGADARGLVQISVPGAYAAAEALKAVQRGLHVFLFSDNVPLAQEVALKQAARERGVLVMGPDCGTAIIAGMPLGFANVVRRGPIGLVAASGTGLQEVTTQIHRLGGGISHAIGTGGRDVKAEVGGISLLQGIAALAADAGTRVIVIVSKPPAPAVQVKVLEALRTAGKPAVVVFIGAEPDEALAPTSSTKARGAAPLIQVRTLVDAAAAAVGLAQGKAGTAKATAAAAALAAAYPLPGKPRFAAGQTDLRALYSGGTYAAEALALWARASLSVRSNVALDPALGLDDPRGPSLGHVALDLGDDDFTVGRPHPMIDQRQRIERLLAEAADPATRVLLLDVVIGWGAHADPAGELAGPLREAQALARQAGRRLAVVGFVCGTPEDPQGLARQEATLRAAGMVLAPNSASAAWLAAQWCR